MSIQPVQLYGPRGGTARQAVTFRTTANQLFQTASHSQDRRKIPALDYDIHRTVTNLGRRNMMTLGRKIFSDFRAIGAAVEEKAELASSTFLPQFWGEDKQWGMTAEAWLENHDKICDVAGPPYDMRNYRRLLLISVIRDGDMLTALVKSESGYPYIQCIPAHRIGSSLDAEHVVGGEYDGAKIVDGVITDSIGRAIAYRVTTGDNPFDYSQYVDISARDAFLSFIPRFVGQVRGFSELGMIAFDAQDVHETDKLQRIGQKVAASISLIEKNELGEAPAPGDMGIPVTTAASSSGELATEQVSSDGVTLRYFKSSDPNAGLEVLKNENPSANAQSYRASVVRDIFSGLGWSVDFALDPTKIGGASARFMIDRINRSLASMQDLILRPACQRIDGYRVASAVKYGALPSNKDWWKWTYQGPARLTADKKYDSDVDMQEVSAGLNTRRDALAARGKYKDDVDKEAEADAESKWAAAKRIADKFDVDIVAAYNSLWSKLPNGVTESPDASNDNPTPIDE